MLTKSAGGKCLFFCVSSHVILPRVGLSRGLMLCLGELLMAPDIPDDHIASAVEIFKIISLNEPDFTR